MEGYDDGDCGIFLDGIRGQLTSAQLLWAKINEPVSAFGSQLEDLFSFFQHVISSLYSSMFISSGWFEIQHGLLALLL